MTLGIRRLSWKMRAARVSQQAEVWAKQQQCLQKQHGQERLSISPMRRLDTHSNLPRQIEGLNEGYGTVVEPFCRRLPGFTPNGCSADFQLCTIFDGFYAGVPKVA